MQSFSASMPSQCPAKDASRVHNVFNGDLNIRVQQGSNLRRLRSAAAAPAFHPAPPAYSGSLSGTGAMEQTQTGTQKPLVVEESTWSCDSAAAAKFTVTLRWGCACC